MLSIYFDAIEYSFVYRMSKIELAFAYNVHQAFYIQREQVLPQTIVLHDEIQFLVHLLLMNEFEYFEHYNTYEGGYFGMSLER